MALLRRIETQPQPEPDRLPDEYVTALEGLRITETGALLPRRIFRNGEMVFRQGETGNQLYVVLHGAVEVQRPLAQDIPLRGRGIFFGEIASLYAAKRTASIRATAYTETLVMSTADVFGLMWLNPPFYGIHNFLLKTAVSRLEGMTDDSLARNDLPTRDRWLWSEDMQKYFPPVLSGRYTRFQV